MLSSEVGAYSKHETSLADWDDNNKRQLPGKKLVTKIGDHMAFALKSAREAVDEENGILITRLSTPEIEVHEFLVSMMGKTFDIFVGFNPDVSPIEAQFELTSLNAVLFNAGKNDRAENGTVVEYLVSGILLFFPKIILVEEVLVTFNLMLATLPVSSAKLPRVLDLPRSRRVVLKLKI